MKNENVNVFFIVGFTLMTQFLKYIVYTFVQYDFENDYGLFHIEFYVIINFYDTMQ